MRSAPMGTTRRLGHRGGRRVETDDQRRGLRRGPFEHGTAIAGAGIHDHPVGPGDQAGDLPDVHLGDASAVDVSHGVAVYTPPVNPPIGPYTRLPATV